MNSRKSILIIGPFGDFGGRELEAGFIADALGKFYDINICSIGYITKNSQLFELNSQVNAFTLNDLMVKKYWDIRFIAFLSYLNGNREFSLSNFAGNNFDKKYLKYYAKWNAVLSDLIAKSDSVLICAKLETNRIGDIVEIAHRQKKPVLFRTTGNIKDISFDFLEKVTCFIHHSESNASKLKLNSSQPYQVIDQCAFQEVSLLKIPPTNRRVKKFVTLARLTEDKNINIVLSAFLNSERENETLYIVGDGPELDNLKAMAEGRKQVVFVGFVPNVNISDLYANADCVIISHYSEEAGPLTGVEGMAAGRIIISSKTGAMPERLNNKAFWFESSIASLRYQMDLVRDLPIGEVKALSSEIRQLYLEQHSKQYIRKKYLDCIEEYLFGNTKAISTAFHPDEMQ